MRDFIAFSIYFCAAFSLVSCFESQQSPPAERPIKFKENLESLPNQQENDGKIQQNDKGDIQTPTKPVEQPQLVQLTMSRIPHRFQPGVFLHLIHAQANQSTQRVVFEICHQARECFQFESTQPYNLVEDHYPENGLEDGAMSISAKACSEEKCQENQTIEAHFTTQVDPVTQKKLEDRQVILREIRGDLIRIQGILQDYLEGSKKCSLVSDEEQTFMDNMQPMIELQLNIHQKNYLDLLGKNDTNYKGYEREGLESVVGSILEQEEIFLKQVSQVQSSNQIGLVCKVGDEEKEQEEESADATDQQNPTDLFKSMANLLSQQFNPVEGFKRNFLESIQDLKDPLRGCELSCPALISMRSRLGRAIPIFSNRLKTLIEIDESLYGTQAPNDP